jgi:FG-GAP-like repeat
MKTGTHLFFMLIILALASGCAMVGSPLLNNSIESYAVALGDLDGDGDLDGFLANGGDNAVFADTIWVNQGGLQAGQPGKFSASRQLLGRENSRSIALGDLDGDGDLDAVAGNEEGFLVYLNGGGRQQGRPGQFTVQSQYYEPVGSGGVLSVVLGDLNGDGALDVFAANCCGGVISTASDATLVPSYSQIWLNDGTGNFLASGQRLGNQGSQAAALGDLDGDGDLDAYSANDSAVIDVKGTLERNQPDRVWLNDGSGHFEDSGQRLGQFPSAAVALGDLDGDGDLDAFVATHGPAVVWVNDGAAQFSDSRQRLGDQRARAVWLVDLDNDGDLDAFISALEGASIWLNDGEGRFSLSRQELNIPQHYATALGDLDGDGDVDLFAGYLNRDTKIWWNDGFGRLGTSWR